jgi:nitroreductase
MDFFNTTSARHSVRSYSDKPVEPEKINRILECVGSAPSAGNLQAYKIFVLTEKGTKDQIIECAFGQDFLKNAPYLLIFCADAARSGKKYAQRGEELYCLQDATIACTYAMLSATSLGLSSVWVGAFDEKSVAAIMDIPANSRPIILLPIGYAARPPRITSRRPINEIVKYMSRELDK